MKIEEGRWLGRLTPSARADFLRFQNIKKFETLRYHLDDLIPFIGLWPGFQLGCFRRVFNLKCREVYLFIEFIF